VNERPQAREFVQSLLLVLAAGASMLDRRTEDIHEHDRAVDELYRQAVRPGPSPPPYCDLGWDAAEMGIAFIAEPSTSSVTRKGKEILVDAVLRNDSEEKVILHVSGDYRDYLITVYDAFDAELRPQLAALQEVERAFMIISHRARRNVSPGEEKKATLAPSEWYDLTRPGRYKIVISGCATLERDWETSRVTSNPVEITVPEPVGE
jgi:hypothetical protein